MEGDGGKALGKGMGCVQGRSEIFRFKEAKFGVLLKDPYALFPLFL